MHIVHHISCERIVATESCRLEQKTSVEWILREHQLHYTYVFMDRSRISWPQARRRSTVSLKRVRFHIWTVSLCHVRYFWALSVDENMHFLAFLQCRELKQLRSLPIFTIYINPRRRWLRRRSLRCHIEHKRSTFRIPILSGSPSASIWCMFWLNENTVYIIKYT